jgi:hypothetical protein
LPYIVLFVTFQINFVELLFDVRHITIPL